VNTNRTISTASTAQQLFRTRTIALAAAFALFFSIAYAQDAHAWWDGKWTQRKQVQFDSSAKAGNVKESLTDVPVLVRLHTGNFSFSNAKPDGSDLRFVSADDKSPLKYHVEKFDPKEEIALIWVKVPRISGGDNKDSIWMYYGNSSAADGQDKGGTFDVNQVAVYHFAEKDGIPQDATSYANHAASFNGKPGLPSVIGDGVRLGDSGPGGMKIAKSPSLNFTKGLTFSAWVRVNQTEGSAHLFSWEDGSQSVVVGIDNGHAYCSAGSNRGQIATPKTTTMTARKWQHLAAVIEPDKQITLYLDGKETASVKFKGSIPAPSSDIVIGASARGNAFSGDLDEVELSNTARPASWMQVAFQGQGPEGAMTTYLEEESGGGGNESLTIHLMKVIVRTITLDGWLIIGFLVLMGCGSVFIFQQKIVLLNKAKKGNDAFTKSFRAIDHPLGLIEKEDDFAGSSLFRVYQAGCEELKLCCSEPIQSGTGLSERAMNGFRAAVEKEAMYVSRGMSAGMVVMNMSVAGGPFLGLLGTVWGVMNTFAGLAESGEANLAAIAPGVASALACTMAGLLVAIPALFASSYITGRIKDTNADVNVFIDDFILMLEEGK
jgi:biopolymer transport protein ExbB